MGKERRKCAPPSAWTKRRWKRFRPVTHPHRFGSRGDQEGASQAHEAGPAGAVSSACAPRQGVWGKPYPQHHRWRKRRCAPQTARAGTTMGNRERRDRAVITRGACRGFDLSRKGEGRWPIHVATSFENQAGPAPRQSRRLPVANKVISRTQFQQEAFLAKKVGVGWPRGVRGQLEGREDAQ
jgi:hypothetical protein